MGSAIVIAAVVGVAVAVQVFLVGRASKITHPLAVSVALQVSGVLIGMIWAIYQRATSAVIGVTVQWWWLPLGALGWGIVAALGFSAGRLGASTTLAVVVAAQMLTGLAIDSVVGQVDLGIRQPVGVVLLVGGVLLVATRA